MHARIHAKLWGKLFLRTCMRTCSRIIILIPPSSCLCCFKEYTATNIQNKVCYSLFATAKHLVQIFIQVSQLCSRLQRVFPKRCKCIKFVAGRFVMESLQSVFYVVVLACVLRDATSAQSENNETTTSKLEVDMSKIFPRHKIDWFLANIDPLNETVSFLLSWYHKFACSALASKNFIEHTNL